MARKRERTKDQNYYLYNMDEEPDPKDYDYDIEPFVIFIYELFKNHPKERMNKFIDNYGKLGEINIQYDWRSNNKDYHISKLPDIFSELTDLRILKMRPQKIDIWPSFDKLVNLREIRLDQCTIREMPDLANCIQLEKVSLKKCGIRNELNLKNATKLRSLGFDGKLPDLSNNKLIEYLGVRFGDKFPDWLIGLKHLKGIHLGNIHPWDISMLKQILEKRDIRPKISWSMYGTYAPGYIPQHWKDDFAREHGTLEAKCLFHPEVEVFDLEAIEPCYKCDEVRRRMGRPD